MGIVRSVINWLRGVFGIAIREIADVTEFDISADVLTHLEKFIPTWEAIYRDEPDWSDKACHRLGAAKILCEYFASYNTAELEVSIGDGASHGTETEPQPCPAQEFIDKLFEDNAFEFKFRSLDEHKEALGGAAIKPYNVDNKIMLDFVTAPNFIPLRSDNRRITDGIFIARTVKGNKLYRLLEVHRLVDGKIKISSTLYETYLSSDMLGTKVPLSTLPEYENLLPESEFERALPLFTYIYPAIANNKDTDSLMGISRFANCIDTLRAVDTAFTELQKERIRARKKIIIPADWQRRRLTDDGEVIANFDADTDIYQWVNKSVVDDADKPFAFEPNYKIEEYIKDISFHFDLLCLQTGLSPGAISFDPEAGIKTATEIRSENSRTFATVGKNQTVLKQALEDLINSILFLATQPDFALLPAADFEVKVNFDDSVTPDRETYINEGLRLVTAKSISQFTYRTKYLGMTKEEAEEEERRVTAETPALPDVFGGV